MAHRYGHPLQQVETTRFETPQVETTQATVAAPGERQPRCFTWRGITYQVLAVLACWHLADRWWLPQGLPQGLLQGEEEQTGVARTASDRTYYRVLCIRDTTTSTLGVSSGDIVGEATQELVIELYHDATTDGWVLDRVYD